jgi:hypothetical protein
MANVDPKRRRVKFYVKNPPNRGLRINARQRIYRGTGHVSWVYNEKQRCVSLIVKSESEGSTLLEAKILHSIVSQRRQVKP